LDPGDNVYFLCRVRDEDAVLGPSITPDFLHHDFGHARNADWVTVSELLVPGRVQRSIIAQRTIQRIRCSELQESYFAYIHSELLKHPNSDFIPNVDENGLAEQIAAISPAGFGDILGPDDYEDLVAAFLQAQGWTLIRSTYFKAKPTFEFMVVRPGPEYGHVQVKCGNVQLRPSEYERFTSHNECVFLLSTHPDPYPGPSVDHHHGLNSAEVLQWARRNTWALLPGVKIQLALHSQFGSRT